MCHLLVFFFHSFVISEVIKAHGGKGWGEEPWTHSATEMGGWSHMTSPEFEDVRLS